MPRAHPWGDRRFGSTGASKRRGKSRECWVCRTLWLVERLEQTAMVSAARTYVYGHGKGRRRTSSGAV